MSKSKRDIVANVARLREHMDRHRLAAVVARSGQNFTICPAWPIRGHWRVISISPTPCAESCSCGRGTVSRSSC